MRFLNKIQRDEKGATAIMVAIAIVVIFGFAVVAIDMSLIQLAKTQLQNAADAAALAGALVLANSNGDQTAATAEAIRIAGLNEAVQDIHRPVVITDSDVIFPGQDSITVTTHRTIATGDPVSLYFLKVLGESNVNKGEVTAKATATVGCISGTDCLKPFCPPDRWDDVDNDGEWDDEEPYQDLNGSGSYDPGEPFTDENGDSVWTQAEFYDPEVTGFKVPDDVGDSVTLKLLNPSDDWGMFWYYAVDYGPINTGDPVITGGDTYRAWICEECEPYVVNIGDQLQVEPGNMVGPTVQGLRCLIELDPGAFWNEVTNTVENSLYGSKSPRIIKLPVFDPTLGLQTDVNGRKYLTVAKILVIFVEENPGGGDVVGRFMTMATEGEPDPDCSSGGFMYSVVLVE
jgi:Flp pilus assembly protein TadG